MLTLMLISSKMHRKIRLAVPDQDPLPQPEGDLDVPATIETGGEIQGLEIIPEEPTEHKVEVTR
jgi:hypothetical protein